MAIGNGVGFCQKWLLELLWQLSMVLVFAEIGCGNWLSELVIEFGCRLVKSLVRIAGIQKELKRNRLSELFVLLVSNANNCLLVSVSVLETGQRRFRCRRCPCGCQC